MTQPPRTDPAAPPGEARTAAPDAPPQATSATAADASALPADEPVAPPQGPWGTTTSGPSVGAVTDSAAAVSSGESSGGAVSAPAPAARSGHSVGSVIGSPVDSSTGPTPGLPLAGSGRSSAPPSGARAGLSSVAAPVASFGPRPDPAPVPPRLPRAFAGLIALCTVIGVAAVLSPGFDELSVVLGGLWPALARGTAEGIFPGQGLTMFLTYGLLHDGLLHLGMNMTALYVLARSLAAVMPDGALLRVYGVSQVVAGIVQVTMAPQAEPVVGASGAIFGLAAAEIAIAALLIRDRGGSLRPLAGPVAQFVGLNVALTLAVPGIAWQAHLGGAAAGLVLGALWAHRAIRAGL